jgi:hypothetical protein
MKAPSGFPPRAQLAHALTRLAIGPDCPMIPSKQLLISAMICEFMIFDSGLFWFSLVSGNFSPDFGHLSLVAAAAPG